MEAVDLQPRDEQATEGTLEWARYMRHELRRLIEEDDKRHQQAIRDLLNTMLELKGYEQLTNKGGESFQSLKEFIVTPSPHGLGARVRPGTKRGGNGRGYRASKLKRDFPDVANRVARGELSILEAERLTGTATEQRNTWISKDTYEAAWKLVDKFGWQFCEKLAEDLAGVAEIAQELDEERDEVRKFHNEHPELTPSQIAEKFKMTTGLVEEWLEGSAPPKS